MREIFERRSIRKYQDTPVSEELVEEIIKAGMAAPSAGNERPWHFIILNDRELLWKVTEFHPYANALKGCSVAIVVCGDLALERFRGFWVQDCSAATQNMLIEATHQKLGSLWLGIYPAEDRVQGLHSLLGLPKNIIPLSIVALGYPLETPKHVNRFDAGRMHHNGW